MRVLITNDDGYRAPGIRALVDAIATLGWQGTVVAPAEPMTGASRSRMSNVPFEWTKGENIGACEVYYVGSTPAACVIFALTSGILEQFDMCLSGINAGENLGAGLTVSGTLGAALEAAAYKVKGVALSRQYESYGSNPETWDWSWVPSAAVAAIDGLMEQHDPWQVANINLPNTPQNLMPIYTCVSQESYFQDIYDPSTLRIVSKVGYAADKLQRDDDISVFAELSRISTTLLSGLLATSYSKQ